MAVPYFISEARGAPFHQIITNMFIQITLIEGGGRWPSPLTRALPGSRGGDQDSDPPGAAPMRISAHVSWIGLTGPPCLSLLRAYVGKPVMP